MKRLFLTALCSLAIASAFAGDFHIDLSWHPKRWTLARTLYIGFALEDVAQTRTFPKLGVQELNPFARPILDRGVGAFTVAGVASIVAYDSFVQTRPEKDREAWYWGAAIIEGVACINNKGLVGLVPIVTIFSARF